MKNLKKIMLLAMVVLTLLGGFKVFSIDRPEPEVGSNITGTINM